MRSKDDDLITMWSLGKREKRMEGRKHLVRFAEGDCCVLYPRADTTVFGELCGEFIARSEERKRGLDENRRPCKRIDREKGRRHTPKDEGLDAKGWHLDDVGLVWISKDLTGEGVLVCEVLAVSKVDDGLLSILALHNIETNAHAVETRDT